MKRLFTFALLILSLAASAQDIELMSNINAYRIHYNKPTLSWSKDVADIAVEQTNFIILQDSLSHSHLAPEIATMGTTLPATQTDKDNFAKFLKSTFNIDYVEHNNDSDVNKMVKLYIIYMFDKSPKHKAILLGDYKYVGFGLVVKDIKHKPNTVTIGGKTIILKRFADYYEVKFYSVFDFKTS
jgi:uncharacterized protein YkwD